MIVIFARCGLKLQWRVPLRGGTNGTVGVPGHFKSLIAASQAVGFRLSVSFLRYLPVDAVAVGIIDTNALLLQPVPLDLGLVNWHGAASLLRAAGQAVEVMPAQKARSGVAVAAPGWAFCRSNEAT